ncbi:MAG: hypothetical protein ABIZ70_13835 [Gemmatimonadales bacterium]
MSAVARWTLLVTLIAAPALGAQSKSTFITEATYGTRLFGGPDGVNNYDGPARFNVSAALGSLGRVSSRIDLGPIVTVGVWDDLYLAAGPRLRVHASPKVAIDVTPQYVLNRGNQAAGHALIDAAVMYRDQIGLSVQLGSFRQYRFGPSPTGEVEYQEFKRAGLFGGVRLGGKPGRYGILADAVALASTVALFIIVCSNRGCD